MKKIIIITYIILFSCKSSQKIEVSNTKEEFILAYKTSLLYYCINESTIGNFNTFCTENNDLKLSAIDTYNINLDEVKNKGKELSKSIKTIDYADYEGRKPIFTSCVSFAFSKEIDSLSREIYIIIEKN